MPVSFELYQTPKRKEEKEEVCYHARPVSFGTVSTKKIVARIHHRCTLSESDITATLEELKKELAECLKEGQKVHLEGLGYFSLALTCEEVHNPREKAVKVQMKAVKFKADKELKAELNGMKFERSKIKIHSEKLSEAEIDKRLTEYFKTKQIITRRDFQGLCNLTKITAARHLRRLIEQKKLQNLNTRNQPIYAPTPGSYGVAMIVSYQ